MLAANPADDARHRIGMARAVERAAGMVDIDAFERGGVVLRLGEMGLGNPPQLFRAHAGRKAPGELFPVDQPFGLGITSHQRRWKQHLILSYELRRYLAQPLAVDASASLNVAPGKIARREPHVLGKALV